MEIIKTNERLNYLHGRGIGFIYNDFAGGIKPTTNNKLHAASCSWIKKTNVNVNKIFFDDHNEALSWLSAKRGKEGEGWICCKCVSRKDSNIPNEDKENPFTESAIQYMLTNYFKTQNYKISTEVPCKSGKIDLIIEKNGEKTIVEIKGEDRGGYVSAEMNFLIGVGQIISRMTDTNASHALAIPLTEDYIKVLRKNLCGFGWHKLDIKFYLVCNNGNVSLYDVETLQNYIEKI
ncbi:MAG: hypothetical protein WC958_00755 [Dehalococcoidales bacterium]